MDRNLEQDYNVARLALFNARLLNAISESTDSKIKAFIVEKGQEDGWKNTPHLVNQSTFMQMSYICLVWLWESVKKEKCQDRVIEMVFNQDGLSIPDAKRGCSNKPWDKGVFIRRLRNALSHGNVVVDTDHYHFHDVDYRNKNDTCDFSLTWEELGKLCEAVIFAVAGVLNPRK